MKPSTHRRFATAARALAVALVLALATRAAPSVRAAPADAGAPDAAPPMDPMLARLAADAVKALAPFSSSAPVIPIVMRKGVATKGAPEALDRGRHPKPEYKILLVAEWSQHFEDLVRKGRDGRVNIVAFVLLDDALLARTDLLGRYKRRYLLAPVDSPIRAKSDSPGLYKCGEGSCSVDFDFKDIKSKPDFF